MNRYWQSLVIALNCIIALIATVGCANTRDVDKLETTTREILEEETRRVNGAFEDLCQGGRMYVGTVKSSKVLRRDPDLQDIQEYGAFSFQVQKAVRGPLPGKELHLGYHMTEFNANHDGGGSPVSKGDILPGSWLKRPQAGDQLLLLTLNSDRGSSQKDWDKDAGVAYFWDGVGPDHPLVRDFEVAMRYLDAREETVRRECFRKLCRSSWPSIRQFAEKAIIYERCDNPL